MLVGPDRMVTETVKGPFSWTDGLGPVRSTEDRSVFVEPYVWCKVRKGNRQPMARYVNNMQLLVVFI